MGATHQFYELTKKNTFDVNYCNFNTNTLWTLKGELFSINILDPMGLCVSSQIKIHNHNGSYESLFLNGYFYFAGNIDYEGEGQDVILNNIEIDGLSYIQEGYQSQLLLPNPPF
jgi:hypothetical protein